VSCSTTTQAASASRRVRSRASNRDTASYARTVATPLSTSLKSAMTGDRASLASRAIWVDERRKRRSMRR
jgi:hypothetical protein